MKHLFLAAAFLICFVPSIQARDWTESRSKLLSTTDAVMEELKEEGVWEFELDEMSVSFDSHNSKWNNYVERLKKPYTKHVIGKEGSGEVVQRTEEEIIPQELKGKKYWAVYYGMFYDANKHAIRGGDVWVFVEKETGEVLFVRIGQ